MQTEYKFCGRMPDGSALLSTSEDIFYKFHVTSYFPLIDPLPQGEGKMMTDGISKIWFEPFSTPPEIPPDPEDPTPQPPALSEQVEELQTAFDCLVS